MEFTPEQQAYIRNVLGPLNNLLLIIQAEDLLFHADPKVISILTDEFEKSKSVIKELSNLPLKE